MVSRRSSARAQFRRSSTPAPRRSTFDQQLHLVDATQWHTIGMDWEPGPITMCLNGTPVWTELKPAAIPQWNMHLCIQLDAMNNGVLTEPVSMDVDHARRTSKGLCPNCGLAGALGRGSLGLFSSGSAVILDGTRRQCTVIPVSLELP